MIVEHKTTRKITLWATSFNNFGQLGINNNTNPKTTWTLVPFNGAEDIIDIQSDNTRNNSARTFILLRNGDVYFAGTSVNDMMTSGNRDYWNFTKLPL